MPRPIRPTPSNDTRAYEGYRKTGHHAFHKRESAGSKLVVAFYRARHGIKPKSVQEARQWYAQLDQPKYRYGESKKRIAAMEAAAA